MLKNRIKLFVNNFLSFFNVKVVKLSSAGPYDLTKKKINPLTAKYFVGHNPIVINMNFEEGRSNRWFDMSQNSLDPPIFAIKNALQKKLKGVDLYSNILSSLEHQQKLTIYKSAAEALDIESFSNTKLKDYPWWAIVNPWDNLTFEDKMKSFPNEIKRNRASNGMHILSNDPDEIIKEDLKNSLPSHTNQYVKLLKQIKNNGFKYGNKYGYVTAEIFIADNELRWKPGSEGNHRVAVAAALGIKTIPVLITKIIRLKELEYWPNVINGCFSKEQARKIFYNIFDAKPSKIYEEWIKKVS